MDRAAVAATGQPFGVEVEGNRVDGGVFRPAPQLLNALASPHVEDPNYRALFGSSCQLGPVGAQLQGIDCGFVGVDASLLLPLHQYLHSSQLFGGVGEHEQLAHGTDSAKTLGVGAGLEDLDDPKVSEVEDEYLGFEDDDAAFWVEPYCLDF